MNMLVAWALCAAPAPAAAPPPPRAAMEIHRMPEVDADPAKNLAFNVLLYMAGSLRYTDKVPGAAPREPHEWSGKRVLAEGSYNGCVEAAKAFKALYDSVSSVPAVFVGGTMKGRDGGHAVVEVMAADGPFLVDAVMFERLVVAVPEGVVARPTGWVLQAGKADFHVAKKKGKFVLSRWQYAHLFQEDRRLGPDIVFDDLASVGRWLTKNAGALLRFDDLEKEGIVKREKAGTFIGPQGEVEHIYLKTAGEPFSGTDEQRRASGQRALEDKVKNAR